LGNLLRDGDVLTSNLFHVIDFSYGTEAYEVFGVHLLSLNCSSHLLCMGVATQESWILYDQMLLEMFAGFGSYDASHCIG
jgi:hypothetical protein